MQSLILQGMSQVAKGEEHASQQAIDLLQCQLQHRWRNKLCL